ncbi:MAG: T9SS type A sorting domain-containing protein [Bacteroidota bacterium]
MRKKFVFFILWVPVSLFAQQRNSIWCFGDSAGIDFTNIQNPLPISSSLDTRGSSVSIADSTGALLFYANTRANTGAFTTLVWNKNNQQMQNGDSIVGDAWYNELVIVPAPGTNSLFYLFSVGVTEDYGLYYSALDLSLNAGLGAVTQKNIQLNNYPGIDCISAAKHANGRDWWLIFRRWNTANNEFYLYLITPSGISPPLLQSIGDLVHTNNGNLVFSKDGTKVLFTDYLGLIEVLDFDRCTGIFSNCKVISSETTLFNAGIAGAAFSPSSDCVYITANYQGGGNYDTSYLYQYNLMDSIISTSKDTLFTFLKPDVAGKVVLAPDDKIYLSCAYEPPNVLAYPYPDSVRNNTNEHLSVVNYPDSIGDACNFQPFSFYLGGKRTYYGLPNNPNYDLIAVGGSQCDTLGLPNQVSAQTFSIATTLNIYYNSDLKVVFLNGGDLAGNLFTLTIHDLIGREVFSKEVGFSSGYFNESLSLNMLTSGIYIISIATESEMLSKKLIFE